MIIETRWRDIPIEEASECIQPHVRPRFLQSKAAHDANRGKPIAIETPPIKGAADLWLCHGPFYQVIGEIYCVCPHLAEIGD